MKIPISPTVLIRRLLIVYVVFMLIAIVVGGIYTAVTTHQHPPTPTAHATRA